MQMRYWISGALVMTAALGVATSVAAQGQAPDFTLQNLEGENVTLSEVLKNPDTKIVLIDFWASWCLPCVESMPHLQKLHEQYAAAGLVILAVNGWEPAADGRAFIEEMGYTFAVLQDPKGGRKGWAGELYNVRAIPTSVLVLKDGVVAITAVGAGSKLPVVEKAVEAHLALANVNRAAGIMFRVEGGSMLPEYSRSDGARGIGSVLLAIDLPRSSRIHMLADIGLPKSEFGAGVTMYLGPFRVRGRIGYLDPTLSLFNAYPGNIGVRDADGALALGGSVTFPAKRTAHLAFRFSEGVGRDIDYHEVKITWWESIATNGTAFLTNGAAFLVPTALRWERIRVDGEDLSDRVLLNMSFGVGIIPINTYFAIGLDGERHLHPNGHREPNGITLLVGLAISVNE